MRDHVVDVLVRDFPSKYKAHADALQRAAHIMNCNAPWWLLELYVNALSVPDEVWALFIVRAHAANEARISGQHEAMRKHLALLTPCPWQDALAIALYNRIRKEIEGYVYVLHEGDSMNWSVECVHTSSTTERPDLRAWRTYHEACLARTCWVLDENGPVQCTLADVPDYAACWFTQESAALAAAAHARRARRASVMTPSKFKQKYMAAHPETHWFDYKTMRFWGDTMHGFRVEADGEGGWLLLRKKYSCPTRRVALAVDADWNNRGEQNDNR